MMLHIIDVSAYQGTTVPAVDAVFVKATEGSGYINPKFAKQYASAKQRARHRGAYHFARPEASSAKSQADRFLDVVQPVLGESVWLDLEASGLSQAKTHAWAEAWAARVVDQARGVTYGSYLGSGYATNNTGRDLAQVFPLWWYPQYPSAYQLAAVDVEALRTANRTAAVAARTPIAAMTKSWPPALTPWLPGGLTFGRKMPDIWQFTDNWNGLDASVSGLTLAQLAGGGAQQPTPMEDDMIERELKPGLDSKTEFLLPPGKVSMFVANADNTYQNATGVPATGPVQIRVAIRKADGSWQSKTGTVGRSATDKSQPEFKLPLTDTKSTFVSVTRVDGDGTEPVVVGAY